MGGRVPVEGGELTVVEGALEERQERRASQLGEGALTGGEGRQQRPQAAIVEARQGELGHPLAEAAHPGEEGGDVAVVEGKGPVEVLGRRGGEQAGGFLGLGRTLDFGDHQIPVGCPAPAGGALALIVEDRLVDGADPIRGKPLGRDLRRLAHQRLAALTGAPAIELDAQKELRVVDSAGRPQAAAAAADHHSPCTARLAPASDAVGIGGQQGAQQTLVVAGRLPFPAEMVPGELRQLAGDPQHLAGASPVDGAEGGLAVPRALDALDRFQAVEEIRGRGVRRRGVSFPQHHVTLRDQGRQDGRAAQLSSAVAGDQQARQPRVGRQPGHGPPELGEAAGIEGAELGEPLECTLQDLRVGGLEPAEGFEIGLAPGEELEGGGRQVDAPDLGGLVVGQAAVVVAGPLAQTQHSASSRPQHGILALGGQVAVELEDADLPRQIGEQLGDTADLRHPGQEGEDVAVGLGQRPAHPCRHPRRLWPRVLALEELHLDRVQPAFALDHRRVAEPGSDRRRLEGGGHHHQAEVRPHLTLHPPVMARERSDCRLRSWNSSKITAPTLSRKGSRCSLWARMPSVTTRIRVFGPALRSKRIQ